MGLPDTGKNIVGIRTFADDFKRIKSSKGDTSIEQQTIPPVETPAEPAPKAVPQQPDTITLTEKEPEEDMVFYDEQDTVIENKPYEEQMVATEDLRKKEEVEEIPIAEELASVAAPVRTSILSDSNNNYGNVETQRAGTVIRDTKRKRFQLIPAIGTALTNWFSEQKEELQEAQKDPYTVTKAKHRVETIKAAAKKSMHAPDKDYELVAQRLKKTPRQKVEQNVSLKPKKAQPVPQWSHVTEDTAAQKVSWGTKEEEQKTPLPIPQTIPPVETPVEPAPKAASKKNTQATAVSTQNKPTPKRIPKKKKPRRSNSVQFPTRLFVGVIVIATLLGIGVSIYFFAPKNTTKDATILQVPSLVSAQTQIPITFTQDHTSLFTTILTALNGRSEVTQVYPVTTAEAGESVVSAELILQTLAPNVSGSFIRSIKEITFGGAKGQPFIIMRTTNFDTAFAGILQWEETISADLSPLFGDTVIESFDPHARTDTQVRNAFFKDIVAANHSARLLVDETGQDRIIYAFINQNTILITTTKESLEILSPLVR